MRSAARRVGSAAFLLAAAGLAVACYDFHLEGPEDPSPVTVPRLVTVAIEYRQPRGCINESTPCQEPVVFFGSWMRDGGEFALTPVPGTFVWRGTARGVPVNFPPLGGQPYLVRVFDPFLRESPTGGISAERLWIGRELVAKFDSPGGPEESGLVYIDDNGLGHNPF